MTSASSDRSAEQKGSIYVLGLFLLAVLLIVAALAIDAANLYRARQALQKAADVGTLAAVGYTIQRGMTNVQADAAAAGQSVQTFVENKARDAVLLNLRENGYPDIPGTNPITVTPAYDGNPPIPPGGEQTVLFTVNVAVQRPINFLLMHLTPMTFLGLQRTGTQRTVNASAQSRRGIAHVSIVLDFSSSMACPETGDCTCLTPARTGPCPASGAKIDALIDAVKAFIKNFDYNNDVITIVPFAMSGRKDFNNTAIQAYTLADAVASYNLAKPAGQPSASAPPSMTDADIDNVINFFRTTPGPHSSTNVCDSLMRAYDAMNAHIAPGWRTAYVLFTDGAPTAGRVLFSNPVAGMRPWNPYGLGTYDYSFFDIDWRESGVSRPGPSLLYQTNYLPLNFSLTSPPPLGDGVSTPGGAGCGPVTAPSVTSTSDSGTAANQVFSPCLTNFGFHEPEDASVVDATKAFSDWSQLFYDCAVQFSDFMRKQRNVVHVIGLGPEDTDYSNPYQTIRNPELRKDIFNTRVANDYRSGVVNSPRINGGSPWPEFGYSGYVSYEDISQLGTGAQGEYLSTHTASDLKGLFDQIAKKILLALVV